MVVVVLFPAVLIFMCIFYIKAMKQYKKEFSYFYRVANSKYLNDEIKAFALMTHNDIFSPIICLFVFVGILSAPFISKKLQAKHKYNSYEPLENRIIKGLILRSLLVNIMLMFPVYIVFFIIGLIWNVIWFFMLSSADKLPNIFSYMSKTFYVRSQKRNSFSYSI